MGAFMRNDSKGIEDDLNNIYELFPRLKERVFRKPELYPVVSSRCRP